MKTIYTLGLCLVIHIAQGQDKIEWTPEVELTIADYQSPSTEINKTLTMYSINSNASFEFGFAMSYGEFMFTKNFNNKVKTVFYRNSSYLTAPSDDLANELVGFGRLEFDLAELSARKFRKRLLESKGAFSNTAFFQPLYEEVSAEHRARHGELAKLTDMGRKVELLEEARGTIRTEINELSDYCRTCKPPKKKKKA